MPRRDATGGSYPAPAMRQIVVILAAALWIIGSAGVFVTDVQAPSITSLRLGSVAFEPQAAGLKLDAIPEGCDELNPVGPDSACPRRYAFAPNATLRTWVSVRNDGPLAVTLTGAKTWVDQFKEPAMLAEPVLVSDAGDPIPEPRPNLSVTPFAPIVLKPGQERLVGVEFRTTGDMKDACLRWGIGTGIVFESIPIEWHWLANTHTVDLAFPQPVEFMAPTEADCFG
jgi:hypothetical protein